MKLADFRKIVQRIGFIQTQYEQTPPNAVCVSRALYTALCNEISNTIAYQSIDPTDVFRARLYGLAVFVDDDMPDEYYQVGYAHEFADLLAFHKRMDELKDGLK